MSSDRGRRLNRGLMAVALFACVVSGVAALLGWYGSGVGAWTPTIIFGVIALATAARDRGGV